MILHISSLQVCIVQYIITLYFISCMYTKIKSMVDMNENSLFKTYIH